METTCENAGNGASSNAARVPKIQRRGGLGQPALPKTSVGRGVPTAPPCKIGVAWDASGSRNGEHLQKEIAALKKLGVEFSVLVFRDRPEAIRKMSLDGIAYDGGTDLAAAADAIRKSDIDRWLLFTDGLDTLSDRLPDFGGKQVTAVVSQTVANRELLRQVCANVVETVTLAAPVRLVRVHGTGISDVQGIGATGDGRVSVHGKLVADETELRLEYSDGHKSPPFKLSKKNATEGALLASVWAAKRVNQLAVRADANEDELLALGRRFGVVSPATSLIVLENLDQYVRHDIEPPASLPDLRRQWHNQKTALAKTEQQKRAGKLDRVLAMWSARVSWWEHGYKVPPDFKFKPSPPPGSGVLGGATRMMRMFDRTAEAPHPSMEIADSRAQKAVEPQTSAATITVKAWDPATPYLAALKAAAKADRYTVYLQQRKNYAGSPAFFVDCAEFFLREGDHDIGVRVLSNLAEMKLEEASLLRVLAWRLQQAGELDRAIVVLRKVQKLRPEEPQSYRDLALALAEHGQAAEAMELLVKVVMGEWQRFEEIELIALEELNALIARTGSPAPASLDPRLVRNLDVDVRIVMSWDADATDVDLHVVEPSGEEASYNHNRTTIGGLVSRDFTQGYGPEEYMVRRAMPGPFKIFAHYYGSRQQTVIGPCTITATVFTNFGRSTQRKQVLTLRLDKPRDRADIGEIQVGGVVKPAPVIKEGKRDVFRAIQVGQRAEEVKRLVGEPRAKQGATWIYRSGDREYRIQFSDADRVRSVIEILPGGAEMILAQ
jgi:tetratricopeptide (TPR) repeat protein